MARAVINSQVGTIDFCKARAETTRKKAEEPDINKRFKCAVSELMNAFNSLESEGRKWNLSGAILLLKESIENGTFDHLVWKMFHG